MMKAFLKVCHCQTIIIIIIVIKYLKVCHCELATVFLIRPITAVVREVTNLIHFNTSLPVHFINMAELICVVFLHQFLLPGLLHSETVPSDSLPLGRGVHSSQDSPELWLDWLFLYYVVALVADGSKSLRCCFQLFLISLFGTD